MSRSAAKTLLISCAVLLGLVLGDARDGAAQTCRSDEQCSALLDRGQRAFKLRDYDRALKNFESAYALLSDPVLLLNIGRAHYRLGHPDKAIEYYLRFQGAVPHLDPEIASTFEQYLTEARQAQARAHANASAQSSLEKPLYKKWWFWTVVVASVAVAATAVGLGVDWAVKQKPTAPDGAQIFNVTF